MEPMRIISFRSYPKVNLALDIIRKTGSGYHEIQTVFHQLAEPFDEITLEENSTGRFVLDSDDPAVPKDEKNTVLKALLLLKKYTGVKRGARVFIKKRIPLMSGLGGGASNAVSALKEAAKLWGIEEELLRRVADQIGMDCAFFFSGGTALGQHFGEKITPLPPLPKNIQFEIIETGVEISSHEAYEHVDLSRCGKNLEKTEQLMQAIQAKDAEGILENLHNDFEKYAFEKFPELLKIKNEQEISEKSRILLCGSGGCLCCVRIF